MMPIVDWLARRAALSPHQIALVDTASGRRLTYETWNTQVNQVAHWLQQTCHITQGQRLAILAHNSVDYLDLCFACGKLGAIVQQMNWRLSVDELAQLLNDAPLALAYNHATLPLVRELRPKLPHIRYWVAIQDKAHPDDLALTNHKNCSPENPMWPNLQWDAPWFFCYTGGTTGLPKAAVISHGNVLTDRKSVV